MPSFDGLFFDMDGVIVDSEPIHAQAGAIALQRCHLSIELAPISLLFKGRTDWDMFAYIIEQFTDTPEEERQAAIQRLIEEKARAFADLLEQVPLVPGVLEFLAASRPRFATLALTTSATRRDQEHIFNRFDLGRWFDGVITAEDIQRAKPDPEPYLKTAALLGLDPSLCLVIEDSTHGIRSAKGAGCFAVGITTSFGPEDLRQAGADAVVESFADLANLLEIPM
ncbi:HAD family hydrolase [Thermostichus vulcanus]|uniref:HAD family phosphatase n=1 Tax=Thermostichus vulcanus str. 'Rupite' TaxID=2813851 RepID=A0ABT0CBD7_THEVL|nr:HAD family phosphatase [Thermostichus vulcanus]MCJ2543097.1 HAD family phosphatase [Thermostichus vulcanus str. 'Rupite']